MAHGSSNPTNNLTKLLNTTVDVNAGNASNGTQRVVLATNQAAIPVSQSGTWTVGLSASQTLGTVTNLAQLGGTAISMNTGVRDAGTQRVTIATNDSVPVTGTFWQTTQPVSGPLTDTQLRATAVPVSGTFWQATQPVSLATLPTLASVTTVSTVTNLAQLGGTAISMNTGVRDAGTQRVTIATNDSVPVTGTFWQATQPVSGPLTDTQLRAAAVPVSGTFWQATQPVSAAALPLPTGAATSAKQPALGTAGTASADVITVQGIAGGVAQPVSGTVTVSQPTAANLNATVTGTVELGATSLAALENISVTVPGTVDLGTVSLTALETITVVSGTPGNFQSKIYGAVTTAAPAYTNATDNALSLTTSGALRVDGSGVTQPVSGTFWQTTQPVSGPLTDTQLRATAVPVSGTVTANAGTGSFTVAQATAANLNATVSIAAAQTLATVTTVGTVTNLSQLGGQAITMGTGVRAAGTPRVTIATDDVVQVKTVPDATATYAPTNATTTAYAASLIAKAAAGKLLMITGYNSKTTSQFIQVHNTATLPADTAVPVLIFTIPPTSNFSLDMGSYGRFFSTGITICNSSTGPTKTIGAADCWFDVQYV